MFFQLLMLVKFVHDMHTSCIHVMIMHFQEHHRLAVATLKSFYSMQTLHFTLYVEKLTTIIVITHVANSKDLCI